MHQNMDVPRYTEARIKKLCVDALAATTDLDVDRIITELRAALEEHIRLAKDSLGTQARTISHLDMVAARPTVAPD